MAKVMHTVTIPPGHFADLVTCAQSFELVMSAEDRDWYGDDTPVYLVIYEGGVKPIEVQLVGTMISMVPTKEG